ncbi:hypothetical protein ABIA30_001249 [Mycobacterium sp. MAA66]|uniref:PucR family transcriptional regulator n=1 Tax=Mycobacterium sp. MAA66 TaxID=3156297 RepID=UPI003515C2E4
MEQQWLLRELSVPAHPGTEAPPATSQARCAAVAAVIGQESLDWAVWTADRMMEDVLSRVPEVATSTNARHMLRLGLEARTMSVLKHLALGTRPMVADPLGEVFIRDQARRGVSAEVAIRGSNLAHHFLSRAFLEVIERQPDRGRQHALTVEVTEILFKYHDLVDVQIAQSHADERRSWLDGRAVAQRKVVDELLAGTEVDVREASRVLQYDLTGHHVALVLWSVPSRSVAPDYPPSHHFAMQWARRVNCSEPLIVDVDALTQWVWIGRSGPVDSTELDLLMTESPELDGWQAAIGRVAKGEVGFRISHRTADYARRFAAKASRQAAVTDSRTVGLAAHVIGDMDLAHWYLVDELGALSDETEHNAVIRETVLAFFDSGHSLAATARELHVARNTVVYRLKRAEELRGRPINHRALEFHAALRALSLLGR